MNVRLKAEEKIKILNSLDIAEIMQRVLKRENKIDRNKEHFWIVGLASNNRILFIELISLGTVNKTLVEPMEVFSFALQKRAVKIILLHNHPSGDIQPSKDDIQVTDKMLAIGKFLNVPVIDHLIVSETNYYSFVDSGQLEHIIQNTTFDLSFAQIEKLKKEIEATQKKVNQGKKDTAKEMAKKFKDAGVDIDTIVEASGLTKKQVERL
ncbi:JAB domain-containing protein [Fulvivirgaceae bacterium BMA10]|uniref:JAB domain-containing protein n=1 Tax=Splendidivirga corallicola TaxID=3051826 RepID=A0ABT8KYA5_9BACT|nr:JAB domain-containing protein [Fulvivirgaceae bacterium BMA10]